MEHMAFPRIPERFLRYVWQRQIFASSPLRTPDGARIVVRFPGSLNPDGGPDFTGASIRIGHVLYRGDVELHIRASSWRAHGHSADPHYNRVILHVVLLPGRTARPPRTASGRVVPLLVLSPFVDPLLYGRWVNTFRNETVSPVQCRRRKGVLPPDQLNRRLRMLGRRRIEARVRALGNRLNWLIGESRAGSGDTAGNADAIRQRIEGCKQQLAAYVLGWPSTSAAQQQLEKLAGQNRELQQRVDQLQETVKQWNAYYASQLAARSNSPPQNISIAPQNPGPVAQGGVRHQVLPEVSSEARNSLRGTVRIGVKVRVDPSGSVVEARLAPSGHSKYFARVAREAAQQWQFDPPRSAQGTLASEWLLEFVFDHETTQVHSKRVAP